MSVVLEIRKKVAEVIRELYGQPASGPVLERAFDIAEETASAYVQADLELGNLQAQVGVRYVSVDTDMDFTNVITDVSSSATKSTSELLPSLTLRYSISDDLRLRFNYGETLRRPNFANLNSNFSLTGDLTQVGYGTGTGGNPDLEPAQAKNYDLTVEWYFAQDSAIYGTLFRREIDGLVVPLTRQITLPNTGLNTDQFVVTQPVNASDGELEGIELTDKTVAVQLDCGTVNVNDVISNLMCTTAPMGGWKTSGIVSPPSAPRAPAR